jgi:hypothetical protein
MNGSLGATNLSSKVVKLFKHTGCEGKSRPFDKHRFGTLLFDIPK